MAPCKVDHILEFCWNFDGSFPNFLFIQILPSQPMPLLEFQHFGSEILQTIPSQIAQDWIIHGIQIRRWRRPIFFSQFFLQIFSQPFLAFLLVTRGELGRSPEDSIPRGSDLQKIPTSKKRFKALQTFFCFETFSCLEIWQSLFWMNEWQYKGQ